MVYGASHRAGQLGGTGPSRPFQAAQSELISALMDYRMATVPNPPRYTYNIAAAWVYKNLGIQAPRYTST